MDFFGDINEGTILRVYTTTSYHLKTEEITAHILNI